MFERQQIGKRDEALEQHACAVGVAEFGDEIGAADQAAPPAHIQGQFEIRGGN